MEMEKEIQRVTDKIMQVFPMTENAIKIADFSLRTYNGELLNKALAICRAIVDFEDELKPEAHDEK